jgi:hypothetical protein
MSGEGVQTAGQERERRHSAVVELDEERWRAWQEKCREHDRATALRIRLWLGIVLTVSSVSGLTWWLTTR